MDIQDIYAASERIQPYLATTPLLFSPLLQRTLNKSIWLKLETQQPTGSFKPRPAFNSILSNLEAARAHGVIASSSGNFAQGVAYAARELDVRALIVMTKNSLPFKILRTKDLGADVVLCENTHEDRLATTEKLRQESGRLLIEPYNSNDTIAGDGTIGLELAEQLGEKLKKMTVLVPISGGGLIAGISFTLKTLYPSCRIIGIQPTSNPSTAESLKTGHVVNVGPIQSIADALVASAPGENALSFIRQYVDDVILVEEEEIKTATRFLIEQHKLVVEPGGAVSIAALFANKVTIDDCVCILSGGNIQLWKD